MPTVLEQLSSAIADRYRIEREIGAGGMATVYLAHDLKHDRPVAVKVLHPELSAVLGADRFLTEIKTTAALQHPHILPLFDSGSANGLLFYVMPLIDGETLRQRLQREKQLPVADAIRISKEVASALDYAHRRGVIHRDIKPENILLHDGQALVADFGIALAVQSAGGARITQTGLSLGTPQYMSPEQAMGERDITARSDVYSLGAVTYEMLVGEAPFTGPTAQSIVAKVMTDDPQPIARTRKTVSPAIETAILTALQKLPADRYGSTAQFAAALDATSTGERTVQPVRPRKMTAPLLGAGALLLALGILAGKFLGGRAETGDVRFVTKTFREQAIFNARLAPDGQSLVYSAADKGTNANLYLIRPDYPQAQPMGLTQTHLLSVSSKGEMAVLVRASYNSFRLFSGTLARVPLGGGAPREMMEGVREADWSPDGAQLAVIHDVNGEDRLEFPIGNTIAKTAGYFSDPRMSPDGSRIAFLDHPFRFDDRGIARVIDLKGKEIVKSPEYGAVQGMAWLKSGKEIVFSGAVDEGMMLRVLNMSGKVREPLPLPGDNIILDVGPDGSWVISSDRRWSKVFARAAGQEHAREMGWLDYSFTPAVSPDGKLLAFGDANTSLYSTILRDMNGGDPARLGDGGPLGFSPDGKWVISVIPTSPAKMAMYPTRTGQEKAISLGKLDQFTSMDWFPDGSKMLICGNVKGGPPTCGSVPAGGGEYHPLTPAGTTDGRVSLDGREILAKSDNLNYNIYKIGSNDPPVPLRKDSSERVVGWSNTGRGVIVRKPLSLRLERLDLGSGARQVIVDEPIDLTGVLAIRNLVVAKDQRVFAYVLRSVQSRIYLVRGVK